MNATTLEKILKVVQICLTVLEYAVRSFIPIAPEIEEK